jgi:glycosyltransferase involved in cell wall biosynthesis
MRILWFTNTPSKAAKLFGYSSFGGGWIAALESLVVKENIHELGICFFYTGDEYKKVILDNVTYYGIPFKKQSKFQEILTRQQARLNDESADFFDTVITDFKPAVIHVFGTELGYGKILVNKFDKVVFHLQGLVEPYSKVYFPTGFTINKILKFSSIKNRILALTFLHSYKDLNQRAKRELQILRHWKYFSGRTDWDRNYTHLINPAATYFHCDELLREDFFQHEWLLPPQTDFTKSILIGTTINPNIYKGLDLIYKVLPLLSNYPITWKVFGLKEDNELNVVIKNITNKKAANTSIKFYGQIGAAELIPELKTCHFFVHPSYIDNSPNSVCEAQLLGMPVLSSAVGGVPSLITHKEDGFLFNPQDKYDLAGLLHHLIHHYPLALEAAKKARATASKRHSPQEIIKGVNNIYNTIYHD